MGQGKAGAEGFTQLFTVHGKGGADELLQVGQLALGQLLFSFWVDAPRPGRWKASRCVQQTLLRVFQRFQSLGPAMRRRT